MQSFLAELKRRKVLHTGAAYIAAGLALWGGADVAVDALDLPSTVLTFVVVATLIGFPVALGLAWALEVRVQTPRTNADAFPRRPRWPLVTAAAVAVVVASLLVSLVRPRLFDPALLEQGARIVVADFEAGGSEAAQSVALAVRRGLEHDLDFSPALNVVSRPSVRATLQRMRVSDTARVTAALASEVALREGYGAVLEGNVTAVGEGWIVSVSLVDPVSGDILVPARESAADAEDFTPALGRLARQLRDRVGERASFIEESPPLPELTTPSLRALQLAAAGDTMTTGNPAQLYRDAISVDPAFVWPQVRLSLNLAGGSGSHKWPEVRALARSAYERRDRVTNGERAAATWAYRLFIDRRPGAARLAVEDYLEERPEELPSFYHFLTMAALAAGDYGYGARTFEGVAELSGGLSPSDRWIYAALLTMEDRHEEARSQLVEHPDSMALLVRLLTVGEKWTELDSLWAEGRLNAFDTRALHLGRGRLQAAEGVTEEFIVPVWRAEDYPIEAYEDLRPMVDLVVRRDTAAALARPRSISVMSDYLTHALFLAAARRPGEASSLLADFDSVADVDVQEDLAWSRDAAEARVLLARGEPQEALAQIRTMDAARARYVTHELCGPCDRMIAAEALEELGQPEAAAEAYEAFLAESRWLFWGHRWTRIPWLGHVHERLGKLYEELGRPAEALRHYEKLSSDWSEADLELQPRVRSARAAAQRLRAGGRP